MRARLQALIGNHDFKKIFNRQIHLTLTDLLSLFKQYPGSFRPLIKIVRRLRPAARRRAAMLKKGVPVPPLLIVSTTDACNLKCTGCYSQNLVRPESRPLSDERIRKLAGEASDLGISVILLAGGEPLLKTSWLEAVASHPEMAGLVFTNGTLLQEGWIEWFGKYRHMLPVISLEGSVHSTDLRRGAGISRLIARNLRHLQDAGVPYGLSITLTRQNLDEIRSAGFLGEYVDLGCKLFIFVEYVPVEDGTGDLALTQPERLDFIQWTLGLKRQFGAHFLVFPGDEEPYGGCLASARGFAHITPAGDLEPCPFAPFSDRSLQNLSLAEALKSDILREIRENHHLLQEGRGGCALWQNREWVASLLSGQSMQPAGPATPPAK
jgi:MoaA/NifB/PqqE/SkfB family radical SAM enzyme